MNYKLPVNYETLNPRQKREVREQYTREQAGLCFYCKQPLTGPPSVRVLELATDLRLFPPGFLNSPVHLQHCHKTGMTEGAVHAKCNAVLWEYEGR